MDIIGSDMNTEIDPLQLTFRFYGDLDCKKLAFQISGPETQIKVIHCVFFNKGKQKKSIN